jgi:hypothetical protein
MPSDPESWEGETADDREGRPSELVWAVKLLAVSAAFKMFEVLQAVYELGWAWVRSHPAAWIELGEFAIWLLLVALVWMGNSFARTLLLILMAWDIMSAFSTASLVYAVGASQLLASMPWLTIAIELCAGCLLLQSDCLEWFRKQI